MKKNTCRDIIDECGWVLQEPSSRGGMALGIHQSKSRSSNSKAHGEVKICF
jgi:hypothetical protein